MAILLVSFNPRWLDVIISPYSDMKGLPLRSAYLIYSMGISISVLFQFKRYKQWNSNRFSRLGCDTMFYYIYHPYILFIVVKIWSSYDNKISILDSICIAILTIAILMALQKNKILHKILG